VKNETSEEWESQGASVTETEARVQKNFKTVLFNDETHTYDYVVEMLTKSCELSTETAFRCAVEVDLTGKTVVFYGGHEACLLMAHKIVAFGPDHRLPHSLQSMQAEVQ